VDTAEAEAQAESDFFADERRLVCRNPHRGAGDLRTDDAYWGVDRTRRGRRQACRLKYIMRFPSGYNARVQERDRSALVKILQRGQDRFNIFCSPAIAASEMRGHDCETRPQWRWANARRQLSHRPTAEMRSATSRRDNQWYGAMTPALPVERMTAGDCSLCPRPAAQPERAADDLTRKNSRK